MSSPSDKKKHNTKKKNRKRASFDHIWNFKGTKQTFFLSVLPKEASPYHPLLLQRSQDKQHMGSTFFWLKTPLAPSSLSIALPFLVTSICIHSFCIFIRWKTSFPFHFNFLFTSLPFASLSSFVSSKFSPFPSTLIILQPRSSANYHFVLALASVVQLFLNPWFSLVNFFLLITL